MIGPSHMFPVRIGILHIPEIDEQARRAVVALLRETGSAPFVVDERSAQSQRNWIADQLCRWCDEDELDLVLTIGGTLPAPGPSTAEIVPEATADVIERELPGVAEAMRAYAAEESPLAMLECGRAGIRGRTLIVNLPASAGPAGLFMEGVVDLIQPLIAHLREEPDAPTLQDSLRGYGSEAEAPESEGDEAEELPSVTNARSHGLSESDFAQFLQRPRTDTAEDNLGHHS